MPLILCPEVLPLFGGAAILVRYRSRAAGSFPKVMLLSALAASLVSGAYGPSILASTADYTPGSFELAWAILTSMYVGFGIDSLIGALASIAGAVLVRVARSIRQRHAASKGSD
jgi:hypothetical protein